MLHNTEKVIADYLSAYQTAPANCKLVHILAPQHVEPPMRKTGLM